MRSRWIFITIYFLTVLDLAFTYSGLQSGLITEGNPVMSFLLERYRVLAYLGVLAGVAAALYFLYRIRVRIRWLQGALALILVVKASVILLHLQWIFKI